MCKYIQKIRSDEGFEQFIQEGKSLAEKVNRTLELFLIRGKRVPRQYWNNEVQTFKLTFYFSKLDITIQ